MATTRKTRRKKKPTGKDVLKDQLIPTPETTDPPSLKDGETFLTTPETYDRFFNLLYEYNLNYVKAAREIGIKSPYNWFSWHFHNHEDFKTRWLTARDEIAWEIVNKMNDAALNPEKYRGVNFTPAIFLLKSLMPNTFGERRGKRPGDDDDGMKNANKVAETLLKMLEQKHGKV